MNCKQILTWLDPVLETQWTPAYHITFSVISPGQAVKKKKYNWQFFHILSGVKDKCAFIKIKYNSNEKNVCLNFFYSKPYKSKCKDILYKQQQNFFTILTCSYSSSPCFCLFLMDLFVKCIACKGEEEKDLLLIF